MAALGTGDFNFTYPFWNPHLLLTFGAFVVRMGRILCALLALAEFLLNGAPHLHKKGVFFLARLNIFGKHPEKTIKVNQTGDEIQRQKIKKRADQGEYRADKNQRKGQGVDAVAPSHKVDKPVQKNSLRHKFKAENRPFILMIVRSGKNVNRVIQQFTKCFLSC